MRKGLGWVREVRLDYQGHLAAWIRCSPDLLPEPGQYLLGWNPQDREAALGATLFPGEITDQGFLALDPPRYLEPGTVLELRGPLGKGFRLPTGVRRLALVAFEDGPHRLLPLVGRALAQQAAVALFCDLPLPSLPASLEVSPLATLPDALGWADFLAVDLRLESLADLGKHLGDYSAHRSLNGQVLVQTAMPCSTVAECGVCAVPLRRGWKYACKDGPVFDLRTLEL